MPLHTSRRMSLIVSNRPRPNGSCECWYRLRISAPITPSIDPHVGRLRQLNYKIIINALSIYMWQFLPTQPFLFPGFLPYFALYPSIFSQRAYSVRSEQICTKSLKATSPVPVANLRYQPKKRKPSNVGVGIS